MRVRADRRHDGARIITFVSDEDAAVLAEALDPPEHFDDTVRSASDALRRLLTERPPLEVHLP